MWDEALAKARFSQGISIHYLLARYVLRQRHVRRR
jgi:hypothetical protein